MNTKSRLELVVIVKKIMECEGTEEEINDWLLELKESVPHPSISDLIFYPEKNDVTAEEIVDEAMSYKPLNIR